MTRKPVVRPKRQSDLTPWKTCEVDELLETLASSASDSIIAGAVNELIESSSDPRSNEEVVRDLLIRKLRELANVGKELETPAGTGGRRCAGPLVALEGGKSRTVH